MKKAILSAAITVTVALAFGSSRINQARPAVNGQNTSKEQYQVKIDNFSFGPAALTVPVGATVTWINQDDVPHTVSARTGKTSNRLYWTQIRSSLTPSLKQAPTLTTARSTLR